MKLRIYLSSDAHERLAKDQALFSWDYLVRQGDEPEPADTTFLGEVSVLLPTRATAAPIAARVLEQRISAVRVDAEKEARILSVRLQQVLALEGPRDLRP